MAQRLVHVTPDQVFWVHALAGVTVSFLGLVVPYSVPPQFVYNQLVSLVPDTVGILLRFRPKLTKF